LLDEILSERAVDLVSAGISREHLEHVLHEVETVAQSFLAHRDSLTERIGADYKVIFGTDPEKVTLPRWHACLDLWQTRLPELQRWGQFIASCDVCRHTVGERVIKAVEDDSLEPDDIIPCFAGNLADSMLHLAFRERHPLAHFIGDLHEQTIQRFMA